MPTELTTNEEFKEDLKKLPGLDVYKSNLNELFSLDKSQLTQEEIRKLFFEKAIMLPNTLATLPKDTINLLKAFRVRLNIGGDEDLNLIRTYSYPNPCFCKSNGRANLQNKAVFYCTDAVKTAFAESKANKNDVGYMSVWRVDCTREVNYTAFFPTTISDKNAWYKTAITQREQMIAHAKELGASKVKELETLFDFISEIFVNEKPPYSLTSWIANSMLYDYYGIDLIIYPSVATGGLTCNLAFHPNFVDNYLKLERVYKFHITDTDEGKVHFTIDKVGKVFYTGIRWENPFQEDIDEYFLGTYNAHKKIN